MFGGGVMKAGTIALIYIVFGVFFLFVGIAMFGISFTVEPSYPPPGIDPSYVLSIGAMIVIVVSLLFLVLTILFFFRTGSLPE
jgi:multisubunit Na+/H+ antiporter MnhB subunit